MLARLQLEMQRREAKEHRCRLLQGLGRPIISFESHGYRLVAVGKEIRWSKNWLTFTDFLLDYLKAVFTSEWGLAEQAKPKTEQHPLMDWLRRLRLQGSECRCKARTNFHSSDDGRCAGALRFGLRSLSQRPQR
jgi:hypothetical protein